MKILLFGSTGQVGSELARLLTDMGDLKACARGDVDFTNQQEIASTISEYEPDVIINAAAYTAVDKAESEPEIAFLINSEAVHVMASESNRLGAWLIHYSTDYVFDGTKASLYDENDIPNPVGVYGQSKLAGEVAIQESGCRYIIFRTSWVYGVFGHNFVKTMLKLAKTRDELNVVFDQKGIPTSAGLIAKVTKESIEKVSINQWPVGIYNLVAKGEASWFEFACYLVQFAHNSGIVMQLEPENIKPVNTKSYPTAAKRPANSRLDSTLLQSLLGFDLPDWKSSVEEVVQRINEESLIV